MGSGKIYVGNEGALAYVRAVMQGAARGPKLTLADKNVLKAVAWFYRDAAGSCFASVRKIAEFSNVSETGVHRSLAKLCAPEFGSLLRRYRVIDRRTGRQTTNEYELRCGLVSTADDAMRQQVFRYQRMRVVEEEVLPGLAVQRDCRQELAEREDEEDVDMPVDWHPSLAPSGVPGWHPPGTKVAPLEVKKRSIKGIPYPPPPCIAGGVEENLSMSAETVWAAQANAEQREAVAQREMRRATANATAKTWVERGAVVSDAKRGGEFGERSGWAERERLKLDGADAALWDEATGVLKECGVALGDTTRRERRAVTEALKDYVGSGKASIAEAGMLARTRWAQYARVAAVLTHVVGARRFYASGLWLNPDVWPIDPHRQNAVVGVHRG